MFYIHQWIDRAKGSTYQTDVIEVEAIEIPWGFGPNTTYYVIQPVGFKSAPSSKEWPKLVMIGKGLHTSKSKAYSSLMRAEDHRIGELDLAISGHKREREQWRRLWTDALKDEPEEERAR
jgi:hypothetical protein